ncbi:acyl-CoA dehydrogenase family protein [Rhodoferax ferrireducens]|uniref:acyl-CoA dehydrogenase family protein n=1 Tax=Rhodoferax ferrireducens TaxID=192843 RepID=UPI000E0D85A0|nr:acyl-CoA dehydrogenase family protein [Rhodoferax ferrireducens]
MSRPHSPAQTVPDPALPEAMRQALADAPAPDCAHGFPRAWWRHLGTSGMLGNGFDCDGGPPMANAVRVSTLAGIIAHESASLGLGMAWMMQQMLGRFVLAPNLRSDRHRALLASMARGDALLALAISEPGTGAHPKHLSCRAVQDGDDWLLDGHKAFVSNGPAADAIIVLAVSGEHQGRKRFDAFVVEANTPGLTREGDGKVAGLVPIGHCGLRLVGCQVPDSQRLGASGQAFDTIARPLRAIEDALLLGAMLGAMQAEMDTLARCFRNAARTPVLTRNLGGLQLELNALSPVARHAAQHLDQHGPDEALAAFNLGARRLFDRWQGACESFAAALDDHEPALLTLARDLRLVQGIARGIAESRQLQAGEKMLHTQGNP